jgi:Holliday junction resolvase
MADRVTAGRKARRKGNEAELLAWRQLTDDGFHVVLGRSGKTRDDVVDLVAINKRMVRIISVKAYELNRSARAAEIENLSILAEPPVAVTRELWERDKGRWLKGVL